MSLISFLIILFFYYASNVPRVSGRTPLDKFREATLTFTLGSALHLFQHCISPRTLSPSPKSLLLLNEERFLSHFVPYVLLYSLKLMSWILLSIFNPQPILVGLRFSNNNGYWVVHNTQYLLFQHGTRYRSYRPAQCVQIVPRPVLTTKLFA